MFLSFYQSKILFFLSFLKDVKHVQRTQMCSNRQDPLNISNYKDLDINEFRVKWPPLLVAAIQDRADEE